MLLVSSVGSNVCWYQEVPRTNFAPLTEDPEVLETELDSLVKDLNSVEQQLEEAEEGNDDLQRALLEGKEDPARVKEKTLAWLQTIRELKDRKAHLEDKKKEYNRRYLNAKKKLPLRLRGFYHNDGFLELSKDYEKSMVKSYPVRFHSVDSTD